MCPQYEDFHRTVLMLGDIALYAEEPGADLDFIDAISPALAASLPEPPPGIFPPGYDPDSGPDYPHQGH